MKASRHPLFHRFAGSDGSDAARSLLVCLWSTECICAECVCEDNVGNGRLGELYCAEAATSGLHVHWQHIAVQNAENMFAHLWRMQH